MTQISRFVFFTQKNTGIAKSSDRVDTTQVSVVIPVKDNQQGINQYLSYFFKTQIPENYPLEIIIVDNDSSIPVFIPKDFEKYGLSIKLITCRKQGPAAARNAGANAASGKWILFNDSDCIPTESFLTGFLSACDGSIGYAGNVRSFGNDRLSRYYESQEILLPYKSYNYKGDFAPQYLITANALIWREAFEEINGFNELLQIAGGEDIDLGLRLSQIGNLSYANKSIVLHDFSDGWKGFRKRFVRYGKGNKLVSELWRTDLRPKLFRPNERTLFNEVAAKLQFLFLAIGYYGKSKTNF